MSCRIRSLTFLPALYLTALGQGHQREGGADVSNVVLVVAVGGAGEPAAAGLLVALEPGDALLNPRVLSGDTCLAQDVDDEAGGVAVAGLQVLLLAVAALPLPQRGQIP